LQENTARVDIVGGGKEIDNAVPTGAVQLGFPGGPAVRETLTGRERRNHTGP